MCEWNIVILGFSRVFQDFSGILGGVGTLSLVEVKTQISYRLMLRT